MRVRIRLGTGRPIQRKPVKNVHIAVACMAVLPRLALIAGAAAVWLLCADLGVTGPFVIEEGLFSHWQVWLIAALVLQGGNLWANQYARRGKARHARPPVASVFHEAPRTPASRLE